ncbi:endolytic transglycosylase MltG [Marinibactrum halimedae]|nr:endolytic transglycosylase MltG [Marinibactrum halimedae]MCD9460104.1 endolytic transglycosylase MltG [Marinibactrum halimedae]
MRKLRRLLLTLLVVGILGVVMTATFSWWWLQQPASHTHALTFTVEQGSGLKKVTHQMAKLGVVDYPFVMMMYSRFIDKTRLKSGEYRLDPGITPIEILRQLSTGEVIYHTVTLIEGWTAQQALDHLHQQPLLKKTLHSLDATVIPDWLGEEVQHIEGWFFPDTYAYTKGESDKDILLRAYQAMQSVLTEEWASRDEDLPYQTPYEALIMASIVEKETGMSGERQQIAGVFVRRLQKKMRLQTDPTVIYGMGDRYQGNITRKDLKEKTPYNTYVIKGLPPTPIALAGRASVYAALHPAPGDALYFVAKGDGSHQFSATLQEHNAAVKKYQIRSRKKNYQSSPSASQ